MKHKPSLPLSPSDTALLVADAYQMAVKQANCRALELSSAFRAVARNLEKKAIVNEASPNDQIDYARAGYDTVCMNGNRATELVEFFARLGKETSAYPPEKLILVTDDPMAATLCHRTIDEDYTSLDVWTFGDQPPHPRLAQYNPRHLTEILPMLRKSVAGMWIDHENIGLELHNRNWPVSTEALLTALKKATADLGEIGKVRSFADWDNLGRTLQRNVQRELALQGVETRYQVNMAGKNSADMAIADDIRTAVDKGPDAPGAIDNVVIATCDRDFRPVVSHARDCGKRVVVIGFRNKVSRELQQAANEVRYLEDYLHQKPITVVGAHKGPLTPDLTVALQVFAWMEANNWRFARPDKLQDKFGEAARERLLAAGLMSEQLLSIRDGAGTREVTGLVVNPGSPQAQAVRRLVRWIPGRVRYCLQDKGMPWVDSAFLARGMARDVVLSEGQVGQSREEAEALLEAAAAASLVVKQTMTHPESGKPITIWGLFGHAQPAQDTQPTSPSEQKPESPQAGPAGQHVKPAWLAAALS